MILLSLCDEQKLVKSQSDLMVERKGFVVEIRRTQKYDTIVKVVAILMGSYLKYTIFNPQY